ncbi:MAG: tripartite tricarboxylate transporter substrate binding protein, partial [Planctomycetes bacterium]|nr:tripartite tricarboxylate transporter substrate binding protein [Planctomycetota bacterium]
LIRNAPYTYKSAQPLCMFAEDPNVIAVSAAFAEERGIRSLEDLLEFARQNPGRVTIGMGGNWTAHDFLRLKMEEMAGVKFNRMAFLGGAPALQSAMDGNCDVVTPFLPEMIPAMRSGKVLPLAVAHPRRLPQLPDVPTTAEAGYPDMVQGIWRAFTVPLNTPADIVKYLERVFERTLKDPEFLQAAETAGVNPSFKGTADFSAFLEREHAYFAEKTREWGVRVDE